VSESEANFAYPFLQLSCLDITLPSSGRCNISLKKFGSFSKKQVNEKKKWVTQWSERWSLQSLVPIFRNKIHFGITYLLYLDIHKTITPPPQMVCVDWSCSLP
jgi:hypothetical protein